MTPLSELPDRIVLALLIYGEARGESLEGQVAVGCVVRNRLKQKPSVRYRDICLAPMQFSCFNDDDPNAGVIARAAVNLMTNVQPPDLAQCLWVSDGVISGAAKDVTKGSTHYLTRSLFESHPPKWAKDQPVLTSIGNHVFLKVA